MLSKKIILYIATTLILCSYTNNCYAFVFTDWVNYYENAKILTQEIEQNIHLVETYKNQVLQYKNMLQNSVKPSQEIWGNINNLMSKIQQTNYKILDYRRQLGGMEAYLNKFATPEQIKSINLLAPGQNGIKYYNQQNELSEASRRFSSEAALQSADQQIQQLSKDAQEIEKLQNAANGATGNLAAEGYNNQIAAHQDTQLLQIRHLLANQQQVMATEMRAKVAKESQQNAADQIFLNQKISKSGGEEW